MAGGADAEKHSIRMIADRLLVQPSKDAGDRKSRAGILIPATADVSRRWHSAHLPTAVAIGADGCHPSTFGRKLLTVIAATNRAVAISTAIKTLRKDTERSARGQLSLCLSRLSYRSTVAND